MLLKILKFTSVKNYILCHFILLENIITGTIITIKLILNKISWTNVDVKKILNVLVMKQFFCPSLFWRPKLYFFFKAMLRKSRSCRLVFLIILMNSYYLMEILSMGILQKYMSFCSNKLTQWMIIFWLK